jgi:lipooligosaccharide transport system permease protein
VAPTLLRVVERELRVYSKLWHGSVFSTFLIPALFLAAIGLGLGGLVDQRTGEVAGMSYIHFIAPGLMAATAMQIAAPNSMWPVMAGVKWVRFYHGAVATPVTAADVYGGWLVWSALRAAMSATAFLIVATLLGGIASPWGVLAIPVCVLCAVSFTAPLAAYAVTKDSDVSFPVVLRVVVMPLFLFSGTFFPTSQLPGWLRALTPLSPLWHAIELTRAAATGHAQLASALGHVGVLVAIVAVSYPIGVRTFTQRLTK